MSVLKQILKKMISLIDILFDFVARRYIKRNLLSQCLIFGDGSRLEIAPTARVQNALFNLSSGKIVIEDYVFFGHNVCILTGTHDYKKFGLERQKSVPKSGRDVIIKKGVWIASNATILGPCVIGENSVIGACCLVNKDIPPNTICSSGNPLILQRINTKRFLTSETQR